MKAELLIYLTAVNSVVTIRVLHYVRLQRKFGKWVDCNICQWRGCQSHATKLVAFRHTHVLRCITSRMQHEHAQSKGASDIYIPDSTLIGASI